MKDSDRTVAVTFYRGPRIPSYARGGLHDQARDIARKGRHGDSRVVHMNEREFQHLRKTWGDPTINPSTGLPEYFGADDDQDESSFPFTVNGKVIPPSHSKVIPPDPVPPGGYTVNGRAFPLQNVDMTPMQPTPGIWSVNGRSVGAFPPTNIAGYDDGGAIANNNPQAFPDLPQGAFVGNGTQLNPLSAGMPTGAMPPQVSQIAAQQFAQNPLSMGVQTPQMQIQAPGGPLAAKFAALTGQQPQMQAPKTTPAQAFASLSSSQQGSKSGMGGVMPWATGLGALAGLLQGLHQRHYAGPAAVAPYNNSAAYSPLPRPAGQFAKRAKGGPLRRHPQATPDDPMNDVPQGAALHNGPGYVGTKEPGGDGRSDGVPARLSNKEYVMDAETMALAGNGDPDAGAQFMDRLRAEIRKHKGKALAKGKFSPDAKEPSAYVAAAKKGEK